MALSDEDIIESIRTSNIKKFLQLCRDKDLFANTTFLNKAHYLSQIDNLKNKEDLKNIVNSDSDKPSSTKTPPIQPPPPDIISVVPVVAYAVLVLAVSAIAAIGMAIVIMQSVKGHVLGRLIKTKMKTNLF